MDMSEDERNVCSESEFDSIDVVDSLEALREFERKVLTTRVVGLDAEWRPRHLVRRARELEDEREGNGGGGGGDEKKCRVSILQIASSSGVGILDLIALHGRDEACSIATRDFVGNLFRNADILKLGFRFAKDVEMLASSYGDSYGECFPLLDIGDLCVFLSPTSLKMSSTRSLFALTNAVLGFTLDKTQQVSDWEKRPLAREQILYAALDASILIEIYRSVITSKCRSEKQKGRDCVIDDCTLKDIVSSSYNSKISLLSKPLGSNHLRTYLVDNLDESKFRIIETANPTRTAIEAAETFDVPLSSVGKSIGLLCGEELYIALLSGDSRIDYGMLSEVLGLRKKQINMVRPEKCVEFFGYHTGTLPPFGHRFLCKVLIDTQLPNGDLYVGGGTMNTTVVLSRSALLHVTKGTIVPITKSCAQNANKCDMIDSAGKRPDSGSLNLEIYSDINIDDGEVRFLVGSEIARMARWLRMLGVDTRIAEHCFDSPYLMSIAHEENRIILTRDRKLSNKREFNGILIRDNDIKRAFIEITKLFGIRFRMDSFMSRCSKCNAAGFRGPFTPTALTDILSNSSGVAKLSSCIPNKTVLNNVEEFWICRNQECQQIFWEGRKYENAASDFISRFHNSLLTE